jgi:hypothetical protein
LEKWRDSACQGNIQSAGGESPLLAGYQQSSEKSLEAQSELKLFKKKLIFLILSAKTAQKCNASWQVPKINHTCT